MLLAATILWLLPLSDSSPHADASSDVSQAVRLVNGARAKRGLSALSLSSKISSVAASHARRMASRGRPYHNPSWPHAAGSFKAWGENVGMGASVTQVHNEFMGSSVHRANILNRRFRWVGVGVARAGGRVFVVQEFAGDGSIRRSTSSGTSKPAAPPPPAPEPLPFSKVSGGPVAEFWSCGLKEG